MTYLLLSLSLASQEIKPWTETRSGLTVSFESSPSIFPAAWKEPSVRAVASPIDPRERDRCVDAAGKALRRYPARLLKLNLKAIYFEKSLSFYGQAYGGTNSTDSLYLTDDRAISGYTRTFLEGELHHELSSILLRNYARFWEPSAWKADLPQGFKYLGDGVKALKERKDGLAYDPSLFKSGFLCQYAEASPEEDFNVTVQAMFEDGEKFWKVADRYPRLGKKAVLAADFYHTLDPFFSEDAFRQSRLPEGI